jgi:hypothetical protein
MRAIDWSSMRWLLVPAMSHHVVLPPSAPVSPLCPAVPDVSPGSTLLSRMALLSHLIWNANPISSADS